MKTRELIEKLKTVDQEAEVLSQDGEFGEYNITEVSFGYRTREGYFVFPSARTERHLPKTYKKAVLLY